MVCNGLLGGLVAMRFHRPGRCRLDRVVAGGLVPWSAGVLKRRFRIDDPVGVIAVHGVCGVWGVLALGLFADRTYAADWNGVAGNVRGIIFGDPRQLLAQTVGVVANVALFFPRRSSSFARLIGCSATACRQKPKRPVWTGPRWGLRRTRRGSAAPGRICRTSDSARYAELSLAAVSAGFTARPEVPRSNRLVQRPPLRVR
jgi:hypothetical protein